MYGGLRLVISAFVAAATSQRSLSVGEQVFRTKSVDYKCNRDGLSMQSCVSDTDYTTGSTELGSLDHSLLSKFGRFSGEAKRFCRLGKVQFRC